MSPRTPPHDLDTEATLVGACLMGGVDVFRLAAAVVAAVDVYHPTHAAAWQAMTDLEAKGDPIDCATVAAQMRTDERVARMLEAQGGATWLSGLVGALEAAGNVAYYARIVGNHARARRLLDALQVATAALYDRHAVEDVLAEVEAALPGVRSRISGGRRLALVSREGVDRIGARFERKVLDVVPTGIAALDLVLGGGLPRGLTVIAARPSMGKTALAWNIARRAATAKIPVLFCSAEMAAAELWERDASASASIPAGTLRTGRLGAAQWLRLHNAVRDLVTENPALVIDDSIAGVDDVLQAARLWRLRDGAPREEDDRGVVVVDYLQLLASAKGLGKGASREQEVSATSRMLKRLSRETGCAVVALSQLNRGLESRGDKHPMLSDLRESGAIEQDADVVAALYRPWVYDPSVSPTVAEIGVLKQRNGPTGWQAAAFDPGSTTWSDATEDAHPNAPRQPARRGAWHREEGEG